MILTALKMLFRNKTSLFGILFGVFLATLLISQQSAIFLGLVSRSYRMVTDMPTPNIWVVDPATESDDRVRNMPEAYLDIVRSVKGVEWASPLNLAQASIVTQQGVFDIAELFGVDDATLMGAPPEMIEGQTKDLRREGGIIVDTYSANGALASTSPNGTKIPIKIGDELEINNKRAVVVGISKITRRFYPQPIVYCSRSTFMNFTSSGNGVGFILAKSEPNADLQEVLSRINSYPGMNALTAEEFKTKIVDSFLRTGILINMLLSLVLGIIIGLSIAGQIFYRLTLENLEYFALIKALGGTKKMITHMILVQALVSGIIGFLLGISMTFLWGQAVKETTLAFLFPWQLFLFTFAIIMLICGGTALLSIRKVFSTDPKVLMGN